MLEMITAVGILALFLACIVTAGYIVFFPLFRTIAGGVQILRTYRLKRSVNADLERAFGSVISDPELGLTMADGGEKTERGQANRAGKK